VPASDHELDAVDRGGLPRQAGRVLGGEVQLQRRPGRAEVRDLQRIPELPQERPGGAGQRGRAAGHDVRGHDGGRAGGAGRWGTGREDHDVAAGPLGADPQRHRVRKVAGLSHGADVFSHRAPSARLNSARYRR
jgi:hypothetical protein